MRIAQVAPLTESVPPKTYGGTERVVHYLTEELVALGHDVTLFASGDSQTSGDLVAIVREALRNCADEHDPVVWHRHQLEEVVHMADKFDVIHFHVDTGHFPVMRNVTTPCLTTMHGRLDLPELQKDLAKFVDMPVVSISNAQRLPAPQAGWIGTVYNGTPGDYYQFQGEPSNYFAFLGRFSPEKGPQLAIEIAVRSGVHLKMAAKIDSMDRDFFAEHIQPWLNHPLIHYVGEVDEREKNELLGGARALLFPICWPEPFGLVMTEAMACGTPVIAFRNGSVDEVMQDGVTGFIVDSVDKAIERTRHIDCIDRYRCRKYFENHFGVEQMTAGYLALYARPLEDSLRRPAAHLLPLTNATALHHVSRTWR